MHLKAGESPAPRITVRLFQTINAEAAEAAENTLEKNNPILGVLCALCVQSSLISSVRLEADPRRSPAEAGHYVYKSEGA